MEAPTPFTDVDDVKAQLLKTVNKNGVKTIHRVPPKTAKGLDNFRMVFCTCSTGGADTLESVVSISDVAPGADWGTGNLLMGFRG
jgi:hypothetical protein